MLTSNVQLGYVLTRGWGQAVQGGLSYPPAQNFRENGEFYYTIYYRNI